VKALLFWPPAAAAPALAAALSISGMLLTACSSVPVTTVVSGTTTSVSATPTPGGPARPARVFGRVFDNLGVTVTGGRLYVTWQVNPVTAAVPQFELTRVEQATGAIKATRLLVPGQAGAPLAAAGSLWVPVATPAGESLLRLDPLTLAETAALPLGGPDKPVGLGSHLAAADGTLWVADGGRLLRVSLKTGQLTATISLPGAVTSDVAANKDGTVLVVSEATDGGAGKVERRNPSSGTVIASYPLVGVAAPGLGGVIGSGVWVAEATGMMGYIERFSAATMIPDPATEVGGSNGIHVTVAYGLAWVLEGVNPAHDYCADPVTGRVLARIRLPEPDLDGVLAVSERYVYYQSPAAHGFYLKRLTVPAACR
jgi:hypothetical protein